MAQGTINNLESLLSVRGKINDNFTELYENSVTETPTEVGIVSGVATITLTSHFLSAESGTTDDLDTVTHASVTDGMLFYLRPDEGDTITITNSGNIITPSGASYVIPVNGIVLLQYDANLTTPKWRMVGAATGYFLDGSAGTPSISFINDIDTGFYLGAANNISIATNGSRSAYFGTNGVTFGPDTNYAVIQNELPTSTNPVLVPKGTDVDTGVSWNEDDELSFVAGGKEGLRIDGNEDEVQPLMTLAVGPIELEEDSGAVTIMNLPVTSTPSDGDEESMTFSIDSNPVLKVKGSADGVGGADDFQVIVGQTLGSISAPTLAFGDGDTGFYESIDDTIGIAIANQSRWIINASYIQASGLTGAATIARLAGGPTTPVFYFNGDTDTGIGRAGEDQLSLIAGEAEGQRLVEDTWGVSTHTPEITTPTAIANYGSVYPKADNKLYFQDGAGVEHTITLAGSDYGEMGNVYGSSATEAPPSANEWFAMYHANITGSAPHLNSGFSFVAGKAGSGNITTAQSGSSINIANVAHGTATGDYVTVQSANHVGAGTALYVDADNFEVDIAYVGNEASTWQMGSYLLVATAGTYRGSWNASFSQSLNNTQTSLVAPYINTTQSTKAVASRLLANNTDVGSIGGNGLMSFSVGDRIWFACQTTAAQTLTFTIRNVTIS